MCVNMGSLCLYPMLTLHGKVWTGCATGMAQQAVLMGERQWAVGEAELPPISRHVPKQIFMGDMSRSMVVRLRTGEVAE